jgi:anthranilate phosphoribosyltransferase
VGRQIQQLPKKKSQRSDAAAMASIKATVQSILLEKRKMKASEAREGMKDLMSGKTTPAQAAAFRTALQVFTADSSLSFLRFLSNHKMPLDKLS